MKLNLNTLASAAVLATLTTAAPSYALGLGADLETGLKAN